MSGEDNRNNSSCVNIFGSPPRERGGRILVGEGIQLSRITPA